LTKHPFLYFDLTYIYSLLTKGYGLSRLIEINSIILAWCYVRKRRLEKALSQIDTSNVVMCRYHGIHMN
jgi:hypothetical protein